MTRTRCARSRRWSPDMASQSGGHRVDERCPLRARYLRTRPLGLEIADAVQRSFFIVSGRSSRSSGGLPWRRQHPSGSTRSFAPSASRVSWRHGKDAGSAWPALAQRLIEHGLSAVLGAAWPRCRVHRNRSAQDLVPPCGRTMMASAVRTVQSRLTSPRPASGSAASSKAQRGAP
jgi:hypothetical protein